MSAKMHLVDIVVGVRVSTIDLRMTLGKSWPWPSDLLGGPYETCLFRVGSEESDVVERYPTEETARAGHARWVADPQTPLYWADSSDAEEETS